MRILIKHMPILVNQSRIATDGGSFSRGLAQAVFKNYSH